MSIPGAASPLFIGAAAGAAAAYQIDRSLRFERADDAYLSRTFSTGNRKTWTFSCWAKLSEVDTNRELFCTPGANPWITLQIASNNKFAVYWTAGQAGTPWTSDALFRDPAAWYHFVVSWDTTQSTASDRLKVYANGVQLTGSNNYPDYNTDYQVNSAVEHGIGGNKDELGGYLAEVQFIDGQALAASDFGQTNSDNNWDPKAYSGSYGTNGFYLKFADNSSTAALGTDSSGNSNTWTVNNLAAAASPLSASRGSNYDTESSTYTEYGTVSQASSLSLPMGNPSHYEGAALRVNSGGFKAEPANSASTEFFMACWAYFDNHTAGNQIGVNIGGNYIYWEVRSSGDVKVRHYSPGNSGQSSNSPLSTSTWHHIALSRSGNTVTGYVDGTAVVTCSAGNATNSVPANSEFNFFGQSGTNYNLSGYLLDAVVYVGSGISSNYTVPSSPLITSSGGINDVAGMSASNRVYASSLISVGAGADGIDSLIDTPTNYEADSGNNGGNYATLSAVDNSGVTLSNGNLEVATSGWQSFKATIGVSSGKYYWESQNKQSAGAILGVATAQASVWPNGSIFGSTGHGGGDSNPAWTWAGANYYFNATTAGTGLSNHSATDIVMYALDLDNGKMWFGRNGTWYSSSWATNGNPATGANATVSGLDTSYTYLPAGTAHSGGAIYNFGQRPFAHTPPTGFKSLCTTNLPDPTIADGSTAFDAKLYNGNGSNTNTISGLSFGPDLVWLKRRNAEGHHALYDAVRGAYKHVGTSHQLVEKTEPTGRGLSAFNSDGFTIDTSNGDHSGSGNINVNSASYVAWAWDAGTSTVSNTDGSITSNVRANQSAGFSICTYTGNGTANSTVGHGLNAAPSWIIIKNRDQSPRSWMVLHTSAGLTGTTLDGSAEYKMLKLESTNAAADLTNDNIWNPTSTTFKINGAGTGNSVNYSGDDYLALVWAPVEGYSAFGLYTGNGNSNGTFVYTGFRPAFILIKASSISGKSWLIYDKSRDGYNRNNDDLAPDKLNQENDVVGSANSIDILSNGFKPISDNSRLNQSGANYIYAAFAEHPFKTARAR